MARKPKAQETEYAITEIKTHQVVFHILGRTPLIMNQMSAKGTHELLLPRRKLNQAEKAGILKHNPPEEFVLSMYKYRDDKKPTRLYMPSPCFKAAIRNAALRMPGSTKTEIGQLLWVEGFGTDIYGIPQLRMDIVRQAGINRTPDIRTRGCLGQWACQVTMTFMPPTIQAKQIVNLMTAAGFIMGVGDWRQEKGSSNYGQFTIVSKDNEDYQRIIKTCGREAQDAAIKDPATFDEWTDELLRWFKEEVKRRFDDQAIEEPERDGRVPVEV